MNNIKLNMSDIGFGANRLGISHGYTMIKKLRPELAKKIDYITHYNFEEDMKLTNKKFYNSVYEACYQVYKKNLNDLKDGKFVITIGGDHSLALGSVKASMEYANEDIGLIWIDAHADINTFDITESGNIHGMPVSGLVGINDNKYNNLGNKLKIKPNNLVYIATRDVDKEEVKLIKKHKIMEFSDATIQKESFENCLENTVNYLKPRVKKVHISLDLDSLNPSIIKGVSTPVKSGLNLQDPISLIKRINKEFEIIAIDIVEYNPLNDIDEKTIDYLNTLINDITLV
ncbi:MAG: arginase [Bacilli bacterium]